MSIMVCNDSFLRMEVVGEVAAPQAFDIQFANLFYNSGDMVTIGQCRPLSKTVRFNVIKVSKAKGTAKAFNKF